MTLFGERSTTARRCVQRCVGGRRSGSLGQIGCNLELANEQKHIRGKSVIEQDFRINLAVPGMGLGFVQDRREVVQRLEKGRHRRLVIERDIGEGLVEEGGLSTVRGRAMVVHA
jgi:hypothetical protein